MTSRRIEQREPITSFRVSTQAGSGQATARCGSAALAAILRSAPVGQLLRLLGFRLDIEF